jgi:HK97 family phage prohead protease
VLDDGTAKDREQAAAICHSLFDKAKSVKEHMDETKIHATFVEALTGRKGGEEFGYGISTAEPYVRQLLALESAGCRSGRTVSPEQLIKDAQQRLVYAGPEMVAEKVASSAEGLGGDDIEMPPNTLMVIQHVLTTDREDRDGDVLRTAGAQLDPKAPLLWQHQQFLPIGGVLKVVEQTAKSLRVVSALLDLPGNSGLTTDIAKLVEADVLRFSHGFRVLDYEQRTDQDGKEMDGFDVKQFEIMEASLVSVPSNVDAEVEIYSSGKFQSDMFRAHAKQVIEKNTKAQVMGVDIEAKSDDDVQTKTVSTDMTVSVFAEPTKETQAFFGQLEKSGRVLSQRNYEILQEVSADINELSAMELSRPAKALCERCAGKLANILDAAKPDEDDDKKTVEPAPYVREETDVIDVVNFVLGAEQDELARIKETIDLVFNLEAYRAAGEEYRSFENTI